MTREFALIEQLASLLPFVPAAGDVWIGDDAAVLSVPSSRQLMAADALVAGVHANLSLTGIDDFGWKALAVNVSDIAAMGGRPTHALVTVAAPPETDIVLLYRGLAEASEEYRCPVVGGDLTNSPVLVVTVCVTGTFSGSPVLRSGAAPGDEVWVSGPLGASAAGLRLLVGDHHVDNALTRAHARPRARVEEALAAKAGGATAMIDVSDGLAAEVIHLASASGVGMDLMEVPVARGATTAEALGGGEDCALVFTAPDRELVLRAFEGLAPPDLIGVCTPLTGLVTLRGAVLSPTGWQHNWV